MASKGKSQGLTGILLLLSGVTARLTKQYFKTGSSLEA